MTDEGADFRPSGILWPEQASSIRARYYRHAPDERRAKMLEATMSILVRDGLAQVTMGGIAERAGISRVTLYRAFKSRTLLLEETLAYRLMNFDIRFFEQLSAPVSLSGLIENYIVASVTTALETRAAHRWTRGGMALLRHDSKIHNVAIATWTPVIAAYEAQGELPDNMDAGEIAAWIMLLQYSFARLRVEADVQENEIRNRVRAFVAPAFVR